ncbi:MAG: DUF2073 domain-containing protein [Candidatus ainarchaeum sp.]|nr:DUF2073 domain-containing protein [Candidatus ainarchaeum sp.]
MIEIEFLSAEVLSQQPGAKKIEFLVGNLRKGKILVLEDPLSLGEETRLIEATMKKVSPNFPGIEIGTLGGTVIGNGGEFRSLRESIIRMLGGKPRGLTVIGPSQLVQQIKKDPESLSWRAGEKTRR